MVRATNKKRQRLNKFRLSLLAGLFLVITTVGVFIYPFPSSEQATYFKGQHALLYGGQQVGNAIIDRETVYVPLQFINDYIDDTLFYDESSTSIILTTAQKVVQMPTDSLTYYVNEEPVDLHLPPLQSKEGALYLSIDMLLDYYPIQYSRLKETGAVWVQKAGEKIHLAHVVSEKQGQSKLRLRTEEGLTFPYTAEVGLDERLFIEEERDSYYFVRKENGIAGYIDKGIILPGEESLLAIDREVEEKTIHHIDHPINLTWEAVYSRNPRAEDLPEMEGVNVVSPTWFELIDKNGDLKNLGSHEYMRWAKESGYDVWALFTNGFDPELTHEALKDFETRQTIIRQLLHYSQMYDLDGLNIDIENVNEVDGPLVTQFMREATPYFHEAGLVVSMDVTFIAGGNWSAFYERDKLSEIVDYMMVMAYDEHWGSSPVAGSVASFPWIESNLQRLLGVVPNEKLILGVPLYTRLWKEEVSENGEVKVTSQALSMEKIQQLIVEKDLTPTYDEKSGQNYFEYDADDATFKVWIEDEMSLKKRAQVVIDHDLAGIASWARFFADDTAWPALNHVSVKKVARK